MRSVGARALEYWPATLVSRAPLTHNSIVFKFALPTADMSLHLPIGQHVSLRCTVDGQAVMRSYTPVSRPDAVGHFDLAVKIYPDGKMTQHLDALPVGGSIDVKGPKGRFVYESNQYTHMAMVAGGTGITPMLQIIRAVTSDSSDDTQLTLLYANNTAEDVMYHDELVDLASRFPQFNMENILEHAPPGFRGLVGRCSEEVLEAHVPPPAHGVKTLLCGPPQMVKAVRKSLVASGHTKDAVFAF